MIETNEQPERGDIDETHDLRAQSWVKTANSPETDFPIQNLPLGAFRRWGAAEDFRAGAAIGDMILDLAACARVGFLGGAPAEAGKACESSSLNELMALGATHWTALRRRIFELLRAGSPESARFSDYVIPQSEAEMRVPAKIGDYTDFYASLFHAENVGALFRPSNPLLPNYKYVPIAYHGRASSIVVSGTPVRRPNGQTHIDSPAPPRYEPSRRLDYELEAGFFAGPGNALGEPVPICECARRIFGVVLANDWSARDIQAWEYQPLGPFLGKNFATSISPWVVTMDALKPFRARARQRAEGDPAPLPYLFLESDQEGGAIDIVLEVWLSTRAMRDKGMDAVRLSRGNLRDLYWTPAQMVAHHTSNGCNLRPGDLLASGTVSGKTADSRGCLLELTQGGKDRLQLPSGEQRAFLEDDDEVILRGYCERPGFRRIGLGECRGRILLALSAEG
ncbi:MAG: fumarylacetoacetase [Acidobacteriota bacterium]|nr:fumarylacetoacetase [Acidobacteriota bacterium]